MYRIILFTSYVILFVHSVEAQNVQTKSNFNTYYRYEVKLEQGNYSEEQVFVEFKINAAPRLYFDFRYREKHYKIRLDDINRIKNQPDKNVYEFVATDLNQTIQYTFYKGKRGDHKLTFFVGKNPDGSYKGFIAYTSFRIENWAELLD